MLLINQMNNTMNRQNLLILLCMLLLFPVSGQSNNREKYNFNPGWLLYIGDTPGAERTDFSDENWKKLLCPGLLMKMRHLKYIYGE